VAGKSFPNHTGPDPYYPGGIIWDVDEIWGKLCRASLEVTDEINKADIVGVTFTTFGVDGGLFDKHVNLLYPVISWQCSRTNPIMAAIERYISMEELYNTSGIYPYNFNTINKFVWFKENRPELLEQASYFLFFPSILIKKLSDYILLLYFLPFCTCCSGRKSAAGCRHGNGYLNGNLLRILNGPGQVFFYGG
jgi:L-fuculokinase